MKKTSIIMLLAMSLICAACWWGEEFDPNTNYISGHNFDYTSHRPNNSTQYVQGVPTALPITIWIRCDTTPNQDQLRVLLQFRVKRGTQWITIWKTVSDFVPQYNLDDGGDPITLFGSANIEYQRPVIGDQIFVRYVITDNLTVSGDLNDPMEELAYDSTTGQLTGYNPGAWGEHNLFCLIYNGKRRVGY